jgi:KaiC/GvpD/RAD55 family RecA-like ATPase
VIEGGVPRGSVVLLLSEIGAGSVEFVYSSILNLSIRAGDPAGRKEGIPAEIRYMTLTKKKEDIIQEITLSFHPDLARGVPGITFEDLSEEYFDARMVPVEWYSRGDLVERLQRKRQRVNILADIAAHINTGKDSSLVVIDSLTDVAAQYAGTPNWNELTAFLRGLQRVCKEWNATLYILLTRGILGLPEEREIADTADAVILFRWEESAGARRQRIMYFEKFRGLMPHLEEKDLVKFAVRISSAGGFEVSNIRVVV